MNNNTELFQITVDMLESFLEATGWIQKNNFTNKKIKQYTKDNFSLAFPSNEHFDDFYTRLKGVIETLANLSQIDYKQIIKQITSTKTDKIEIRIKANLSQDGKLPLGYASECIEALKELVLYSACAEYNARPVCNKPSHIAIKCLSSFKLAQTEIGSYIFNVDAPAIDAQVPAHCTLDGNLVYTTTLEHKVVERIETALSQIDQVSVGEKQMTEITSNAYETGATANMCEALLKLKPDTDNATIETSIYYAADSGKKNRYIKKELSTMQFAVAQELSRIYRDNVVVLDVELTGEITKIQWIDDNEINATFKAIYNGKSRSISLIIPESQHDVAVQAFKEKLSVIISGELDMSSKKYEFLSVSDFKLLSE